jgi:hypothetical protein
MAIIVVGVFPVDQERLPFLKGHFSIMGIAGLLLETVAEGRPDVLGLFRFK